MLLTGNNMKDKLLSVFVFFKSVVLFIMGLFCVQYSCYGHVYEPCFLSKILIVLFLLDSYQFSPVLSLA